MTSLINVPCDTCSLCCRNVGIKLKRPMDYDTDDNPRFITMPVDGEEDYLGFNNEIQECIYLHKGKCLVHKDKPEVCRVFDCRKLTMVLSKEKALEFEAKGTVDMKIWSRGKELLLGQIGP